MQGVRHSVRHTSRRIQKFDPWLSKSTCSSALGQDTEPHPALMCLLVCDRRKTAAPKQPVGVCLFLCKAV